MTTERRTATDLARILGDLAAGPYPDYIDDVLARTALARQSRAWPFPVRFLHMMDAARATILAPRMPWRTVAIALLLIALLLAGLVVIAGQLRTRPPALPYGPAANGVIAFESGGDIYTADARDAELVPLITGPEQDLEPRFSLDGTKLAFERRVEGDQSQVFVAPADGSQPTLVTPQPLDLAPVGYGRGWEQYAFSPDGSQLVIGTWTDSGPAIVLAEADGSGARTLDVGMPASEPVFRPPSGDEILFVGGEDIGRGQIVATGIYAVDVATGNVRMIVEALPDHDLAGLSSSPDGSQISYWTWGPGGEGVTARTHVAAADGSGDRELPAPAGALWNAHATWSNDGTRLFVAHGFAPEFEDVRGWVVPADGSGIGDEIAPAGMVGTECCAAWLWSPDDSMLLGRLPADGGAPARQVVIDVAAREARAAGWDTASAPTWQRRAP